MKKLLVPLEAAVPSVKLQNLAKYKTGFVFGQVLQLNSRPFQRPFRLSAYTCTNLVSPEWNHCSVTGNEIIYDK